MLGYVDLDLDKIRETMHVQRAPFPHQREAFDALNSTFNLPLQGYKGSLLVLPTGGGKTFTATNWICRSILSRNIKVLWLAQSSYLLDQAAQSFIKESTNILHSRKSLKVRTVSSSSSHSNSGNIELSDDVVIVTTQTAISDVLNETIGFKGESLKFKLRRWIDNCVDSELFVVLDEAHHAPAYGCRTLLTELRDNIKNLYVLGLTATPTHNDQRIRGWLEKIFDRGICYQAEINNLYKTNILAMPVYIQKATGKDMEVDDKLYARIMNQHKDLPDSIIDTLASDSARNNFIINDYIQNKEEYGKTIIFADRWFQCEYLVEKLRENGIRADSIYVMSSGNKAATSDGQGRRDNKQNEAVLKNFRDGKLDVLVNVKMLTEGVDVPDVKSVMLTRNTTSGILFTQMIGRALRGKKAGGGSDKDKANIVLFVDNWKRLLPFANIADISGNIENLRSIRTGVPPMEWISVLLVRRACKDIEFIGKEQYPCKYYLPIGWYETEYAVSVENDDGEEIITANNAVLVYETNNNAFKKIISFLTTNSLPEQWSSEAITAERILDEIWPNISNIIDFEDDDIDGNLKSAIVSIVRHMAQNGVAPEFIPFEIRDHYDIDKLVEKYENLNTPQRMAHLRNDFQDTRLLWSKLYKKFDWFWQAYTDAELRRYYQLPAVTKDVPVPDIEEKQPEGYRSALLSRENKKCRCCGRQLGKGVKLEIDHIIPVKMGGKTELDNLQILCKTCNLEKGTQLISFLNNRTPLEKPMDFKLIYSNANEPIECSIKRIINYFYRTDAVCNIQYHQRSSGKYYHSWIISLHEGNPVNWLIPHKKEILRYIQNELGWVHVQDITIVNT